MNNDRLRYKVFKILVENFQNVKDKFRFPDIDEAEYDKLEIPIEEILKTLKIS